MHVQLAAEAKPTHEYNCNFRRLYPWKGVVETPWGSAWAKVPPGETTTKHSHGEKETFLILAGTGQIHVDEETRTVSRGDVIYLPPCSEHTIKNVSASEDLEVLCLWWDG